MLKMLALESKPIKSIREGKILLVFILIYPFLRLCITQHIENPVISDGILALDMVLPVVAGILFGPRMGLLAGLFGASITYLISLPSGIFDSSLILCAILPLGVAGYLSGILSRRYSIFISSLSIALVHPLNIGAFYLFGLRSSSELFTGSVGIGLVGEVMIDIIAINLICLIYEWWHSGKKFPKIESKVNYLPLALITILLASTVVITFLTFPQRMINHLFLSYIAILVATIFYGRALGLSAALISGACGIAAILNLENYSYLPDVPGKIQAAFLHTALFGIVALATSELVEQKKKAISQAYLFKLDKERLEKQDKERRRFIHNLAHDLKTPLTSIIASGKLLVEKIGSGVGIIPRLVRNINQSAQNMDGRISELLDIAGVETTGFELRQGEIDPLSTLKDAATELSSLAQRKNQELRLELPLSLSIIKGDKVRIGQIVQNLLSNAVKFSPKGGTIILRAEEKDGELIVEVKDTGPGIPPEELTRVFEPYHRLEAHQNLPGVGLGLSWTKKLVELHQGKIWVESKEGKGSKFSFSLPTMKEENYEGGER
jgi:signal transduction histidine kinase